MDNKDSPPPYSGPTAVGGYPPPQGAYQPPHGGYPPPQTGYQQPHAGYPPPHAGYPPPHAGYPPPHAGYPPPQGYYPTPPPMQQSVYSTIPVPQWSTLCLSGSDHCHRQDEKHKEGMQVLYCIEGWVEGCGRDHCPCSTEKSTNNVVVVNQSAPMANTVIVQRRGVNHCLHFIITLFFWPWLIVWICLCIMDDS